MINKQENEQGQKGTVSFVRDAQGTFRVEEVPERAILVGVSRRTEPTSHEALDHLDELESLAVTAGAIVVEKMTQDRKRIDVSTFIGKGKAETLAERVELNDIQLVIFDDDLTPVQVRNLERITGCKIIDRTGLILDIFARHARSNEAKTQVELAQLEYLLPRLTRQWTHLSKQYGGIGTKGPGETQIETDRRLIRSRIDHLKKKLKRIERRRETQRKGRDDFVRVALVGYTNVGKSTLLNILTDAGVFVENQLFATLDSTVRSMALSSGTTVLISDTVGFIRKLPTTLVASFKSTLEEIVEADIILHLVDAAHPRFPEQIAAVNTTLDEIHAGGKPGLLVFNKIDVFEDSDKLAELRESFPEAVFISAARGINISTLMSRVEELIELQYAEFTFSINPVNYRIVNEIHEITKVLATEYEDSMVTIRCRTNYERATQLLKRFPDLQRIV